MKKALLIVVIVVVLLLVAGIVTLGLTMDKAVKTAIETVGPKITKVDVRLNSVKLSLLNGSGDLNGFALGNPPGYTSPTSIQFDSASLALQPKSLLSDKVVIRHVRLAGPVITFEGGLKGNNLNDLIKGMESDTASSDTGSAPAEDESAPGNRKLQVDEFTLTGAKVQVKLKELGNTTQTLTLPDIHLTDLGTGPDGITSKELTRMVLNKVVKETINAVVASGGNLEQLGKSALQQLNTSGNEDAAKAIRGAMDLFKKKK